MDAPTINWFGSMLVARELLSWTKGGKPDEADDSFIAKLNRPNLAQRMMAVGAALHQHGPSLEAATAIQSLGWFSEVSAQALADRLVEAVERLKDGGIWKFRAGEFGTLVFDAATASE